MIFKHLAISDNLHPHKFQVNLHVIKPIFDFNFLYNCLQVNDKIYSILT